MRAVAGGGRERPGFRGGGKRNARAGVAVMWIGIFVLLTFGGAAVACLFIAFRAAQAGKWHVFGALLLPALVIGGTIIMLVWKPVLLELFGDDNLEDLPATAVLLEGEALAAAHNDTARFGLRYNDETETFHWYDEAHTERGGFKGQDDTGFTWSGGWDLATAGENGLCLTLGQDENCFRVFRDGDLFYDVNHRDEIVNRFIMIGPVEETGDESRPLAQVPLTALLQGRTLAGDLLLHFGVPAFSAHFAADSDALTVMRGPDASSLTEQETGTYAIGEDGKLCLMGVLHIVEECFDVLPSPKGLALARPRGRIVAWLGGYD